MMVRIAGLALGSLVMCVSAAGEQAWFHFQGYTGSTTLTNFQALVKLPEAVPDFRASVEGQDIYTTCGIEFYLYDNRWDFGGVGGDHAKWKHFVSQMGKVSCGRPVPVRARKLVARTSKRPHEDHTTGTVTIRDVYAAEAMKGAPAGCVKSLRVVSLDYRPVGTGWNLNQGALQMGGV